MKKIIYIFSVLFALILLSSNINYVSVRAEVENSVSCYLNDKSGIYLLNDTDNEVEIHSNYFVLSYEIDDDLMINDILLTYETNNVRVNAQFTETSECEFTVSINTTDIGEFVIKIICTAVLSDEETITLTDDIFIYARDDYDFLSKASMLDAKFYCYTYVTGTENPTFEGFDNFYSTQIDDPEQEDVNLTDISTQYETTATATGTVTVFGTITWVDQDNHIHNAANVTVKLLTKGFLGFYDTISTATTNDNGYYEAVISNAYFASNGGKGIKLGVSTQGGNIVVKNAWGVVYEVYQAAYTKNATSSDLELNFEIDPADYMDGNENRAYAFGVHQAMNLGAEYVESKIGYKLDTITVKFPTILNTSCYFNDKLRIMLEDRYDWDVMLHEYGHYVADCLDIAVILRKNHSSSECLNYKYGKDKGMQLAWSEGWATYFSIASQLEMNTIDLNITNVGDTLYTDTDDGDFFYDIETPDVNRYRYGESSEIAVAAVLLDLADGISEDVDNIALGYDDIWKWIVNNQCVDFSSFINVVYQNITNVDDFFAVGDILTAYEVAPAPLSPGRYPAAGWTSPTFTWDPQGGENGEDGNYANNLFTVVFYNNDKELIYETENLTGNTYTPSSHIWYEILSNSEDELYWSVKACQTTTYETGPYYSTFRKINIPDVVELNTTTNVNDSVGVNEVIWYKFTAPALSKYAFFTTGNCDTYGELFPAMVPDNTFTNKYSGDDDSGDGYNFRIVYNLTPGQVVYLRVSRLSDSETEDFTLCVEHVHEYVYRSVNSRFHILKCNCGATSGSNQAHVINGSYSPPDGNTRYKPCIGCGESIDTWAGGTFPIIKNNVIAYVTYQNRLIGDEVLDLTITETNMSTMVVNGAKYSANGSYILPDGTVVLVEEDVDAYFAGTLVFYDEDETPLME